MISVIGNAPVDLIARVDDDFLARNGLAKGICTTIDEARQAELLSAVDYKIVPGGTGANIAAALGLLKADIRFIGSYGADDYGTLSIETLKSTGAICYERPQSAPTQIVFTFLTDDGERTFAAFYHPGDFITSDEMFGFLGKAPQGPIIIDSYKLHYPIFRDNILNYIDGIDATTPVVFCPADLSVLTEQRDACDTLHKRCTHILLNREQSIELLGTTDVQDQIQLLQKQGKTGALTQGPEGAFVFDPQRFIFVPSVLDPKMFVDSNGAGDGFAAGYVYGLVHNFELAKIGLLASRCAAVVLSTEGARAPADLADRVFEKPL